MGDPADEVPTETPVEEEIVIQSDMEADEGEANPGQGDVEMEFIGNCEVLGDLGSLEPSVDDSISSLFL